MKIENFGILKSLCLENTVNFPVFFLKGCEGMAGPAKPRVTTSVRTLADSPNSRFACGPYVYGPMHTPRLLYGKREPLAILCLVLPNYRLLLSAGTGTRSTTCLSAVSLNTRPTFGTHLRDSRQGPGYDAPGLASINQVRMRTSVSRRVLGCSRFLGPVPLASGPCRPPDT